MDVVAFLANSCIKISQSKLQLEQFFKCSKTTSHCELLLDESIFGYSIGEFEFDEVSLTCGYSIGDVESEELRCGCDCMLLKMSISSSSNWLTDCSILMRLFSCAIEAFQHICSSNMSSSILLWFLFIFAPEYDSLITKFFPLNFDYCMHKFFIFKKLLIHFC